MIGQTFMALGQTALSLAAAGTFGVATALAGTAAAVPVEQDRIDLVSGPDDGAVSTPPDQVRTDLAIRGRGFAEKPPAIFPSDSPRRSIPTQGDLGSALALGLLFALGAGAIVTLLQGGRRGGQGSESIPVGERRDVVASGRVLSVDTLLDWQALRDRFHRARLAPDEFERVLDFLMDERNTRREEALDFLFEVFSDAPVDRSLRGPVLGLFEFLTRFPDTPLSSKAYTKLQYLVIDHPEKFGMFVVQFLGSLLDVRSPRRAVQARISLGVLAATARPDIARSARRILNRAQEAEEADESAGLDRMETEIGEALAGGKFQDN